MTDSERAVERAQKEAQIQEQEKKVEQTEAAWVAKMYEVQVPDAEKKPLKQAFNQARRDLIGMKEDLRKPSKLLQVWFPGYHVNIGGGSTNKNGDLEGMLTPTNKRISQLLANFMDYRNVEYYFLMDASANPLLLVYQRNYNLPGNQSTTKPPR